MILSKFLLHEQLLYLEHFPTVQRLKQTICLLTHFCHLQNFLVCPLPVVLNEKGFVFVCMFFVT